MTVLAEGGLVRAVLAVLRPARFLVHARRALPAQLVHPELHRRVTGSFQPWPAILARRVDQAAPNALAWNPSPGGAERAPDVAVTDWAGSLPGRAVDEPVYVATRALGRAKPAHVIDWKIPADAVVAIPVVKR